ncbi:MBL fold metallo-hydrolase [Frigidibacter sp. MR17.14]|uniref:MBL fold metallo-hydrolase n=1 Tax=Frigidibacter sp. MR17.14 TaxID=3126509 RepID=UPI003012A1E5
MLTKTSPSRGAGSPEVIGFHDKATGSCQYLVIDPATREAALIDVVLDFDPVAARTRTVAAEYALKLAEEQGVKITLILDTHPHADHLSAGHWLSQKTGAPHWIGEKCTEIAGIWTGIYHLPEGTLDPARDHDRLLADGETFRLGTLTGRVMLSPGHTLGSITYVIGDAAFVHDTLMQPDAGTSRCDFPGGSAAMLWDSLQAIFALPGDTRLFIGHDYGTKTREEPAWESTVAEQKATNIQLAGRTREEWIAVREARDATLALPRQMLHALQVNLRGGRLPEPEADGQSYFKIPANHF